LKSSRLNILENTLVQVLNNLDELLVISDTSLIIEFANTAFAAVLDLPYEKLIQKSLHDFFVGLNNLTSKLSIGVPGVPFNAVVSSTFNNQSYQLNFSGLYSDQGILTGYTIRIKEQSLLLPEIKQQNKYKALFNDVQEGIIVMDNDSRIIEVNSAACAIFQIESEKFQTLQVRHIFPHNSDAESDRLWVKFMAEGIMFGYYKYLIPNGTYRYIDFKAKTNFIDGLHLAVFNDVTDKKQAQEALKTSEYQLKAIFDSTMQLIVLLDEQLKILKLNNNAKFIIKQYSGQEEVIGKSILAIFPRLLNTIPEAELYLNRVFRGEIVSFESTFPNNSNNWYDVILSPVYDKHDRILSICITCLETTLRKKTELSLASSEARFRSLVQNSSDLIAILDKNGNVTYSSSSFFKILGYTDTTLKNRNLAELIVDEDKAKFTRWLAEIVDTNLESLSLEFRIRHADGYFVYLESIFNNQINNPFINGVILNARDSTVRKYHEENLLLLERAIDSSENGIFITDSAKEENPIIYVNKAFEKITGYKKEEIKGEGFLKIFDEQSYLNPSIAESTDEARLSSVLVENTRKNGQSYWSELNISPVYNKAHIQSNYIGVITDVTEKKNAEDALKEIVNGMASVSEKDFFETLVLYLEASIKADIVFIAELNNARKLETRAFIYDGKRIDSIELEDLDTPWYLVIKEKQSVYSAEIFMDFPEVNCLPGSFSSFCGVPLFASNGDSIGVLGAINRGPMEGFEFAKSLLKLFSVRTSAELNRQKYLKTLTSSESKFRALAANSPDLILIYNLHDRTVEYINKEEFLGYSYKELSDDELWAKVYPNMDLLKVQNQLVKAIKGALPINNTVDLRIYRKDGQMEWITTRISILEKKNNWTIKLLITANIITERKDAEEALRESEDRLKALTENTNDLLFSVDSSMVFTTMNTAFKKFVRKTYKQKAEIGQHVSTVFKEQLGNNEWVKLLKKSLTNKKLVKEVHVNPDFGTETFEVLLNPIYQENKEVVGVSVFARDITRRIKAENDIKQTNFELDSFVYRASHDLRAPLRSVLGLLNLVELENETKARNQYIKLAHKSINKLDSFISDLTDFTRNSRLSINSGEINFENLVDETIERLQFMDKASRVKIIKSIDPKPFISDLTRISIIVQNLVSNAIKYQNEYLEVSLCEIGLRYIKDDLVEIWVKDNGRGIREEFQDKVFEMFFRASADSNGSGLGLYITKQVVDKLKGTIKLKSAPGDGTEIRVVLPITASGGNIGN